MSRLLSFQRLALAAVALTALTASAPAQDYPTARCG